MAAQANAATDYFKLANAEAEPVKFRPQGCPPQADHSQSYFNAPLSPMIALPTANFLDASAHKVGIPGRYHLTNIINHGGFIMARLMLCRVQADTARGIKRGRKAGHKRGLPGLRRRRQYLRPRRL